MKVAFVVNEFPAVTETFIINQIADLIDRGVDVDVFAFSRGPSEYISSRYESHKMSERVHYLRPPNSRKRRLFHFARTLMTNPLIVVRLLHFAKYRKTALSQVFFKVFPFIGKEFDLVHCHFGNIANAFLDIRDALQLKSPFVTSFYGYDVSLLFNERPPDFYDRLRRECPLFFVMSDNMKRRVVAHGFPENKVKVHPVSVEVDKYPFSERKYIDGLPIELLFIGRFVEKKGVDDLIRALAIVRQKSRRTFRCTIIGGGHQEQQVVELVATNGLEDLIEFRGFMKIEDIIALMPQMHIMLQPSKTATNGDME